MEIDRADFPPGRWRAQWIWWEMPPITIERSGSAQLSATARPRFACFRRTFRLHRVPERVPARLTSDSRHILWVNGIEAARGPVRGNPRRLHYDIVDLAPYLRTGDNLVAVLVAHYVRATPWWMPIPPTYSLGAGALAFEARLAEDDWVVSDSTWRAFSPPGWSPSASQGLHAAPIEMCDASKLAPGWLDPDFDDGDWNEAVGLTGSHIGATGDPHPPTHPFGPLLPRPIPQLGGAVKQPRVAVSAQVPAGPVCEDPVAQIEADEGSRMIEHESRDWPILLEPASGVHLLTIDFGETVCGTVILEAEAPAGTCMDVSVAEGLTPDGRLDRLDQYSGFRYRARGFSDRFETFDSLGFRYARLAVRPGAGPVTLRRFEVAERLFPRPSGPFFSCSDPLLERIWAIGRRTVDLCSHDAYIDCPSREQRAWTGDSVVHLMVDLATNPDWSLARRHVELTASMRPDGMLPMAVGGDMEAADATFIPDWPLHWIRALHHLYRYTGDRELIARMLVAAEGVLRWFVPFQGPDGLLTNVTGWILIDWSAVSVAGTSGVLNALWARALLDFAEMAEWLGDRSRSEWARTNWARVRDGFQAFWEPERGLYVDHILDDVHRLPVSQHTNAAAICAGLVPEQRTGALFDKITDPARLVRASWLLPGRTSPPEDGNMYAGAFSLVTGPDPPWWDVESQIVAAQPFFRYVVHDAAALAGRAGRVATLCRDWEELIDRSPATWSETWFGGSRCHGWSSTPTRDLIVYTLGIVPAEPGCRRIRIAPDLGDLEWAHAAVPTPYGPVTVRADRQSIHIETPVPVDVVGSGGNITRCGAGRYTLAR